jgi:hypothetical protein
MIELTCAEVSAAARAGVAVAKTPAMRAKATAIPKAVAESLEKL